MTEAILDRDVKKEKSYAKLVVARRLSSRKCFTDDERNLVTNRGGTLWEAIILYPL